MFLTLLSGTTEGLLWALLAIGVYISYRILDMADLTCEGSVVLGGVVCGVLMWDHVNPILAILIAFLAGCLAGCVSALLTTKLKIPPILSGILTMLSLYTINIRIMSLAIGRSGANSIGPNNPEGVSISDNTIFRATERAVESIFGFLRDTLGWGFLPKDLTKNDVAIFVTAFVCILIIVILYFLFGTEIGAAIRATGTNEKMCRAQGINTDTTKIIGLALSNGLIAVSGALLYQYNVSMDVNFGAGSIVIGLASIIIGEVVFMKAKNFFLKLLGIIVGSIIYRVIIAFIIKETGEAQDVKLLSAAVVVLALVLSTYGRQIVSSIGKKFKKEGKANG